MKVKGTKTQAKRRKEEMSKTSGISDSGDCLVKTWWAILMGLSTPLTRLVKIKKVSTEGKMVGKDDRDGRGDRVSDEL